MALFIFGFACGATFFYLYAVLLSATVYKPPKDDE